MQRNQIVAFAQENVGFSLSWEWVEDDGVTAVDLFDMTFSAGIYDAIGGTLQYSMSAAVSGDSDNYLTVTAEDSHGLSAGTYYLQVNRTDGDPDICVETGKLVVAGEGGLSTYESFGAR